MNPLLHMITHSRHIAWTPFKNSLAAEAGQAQSRVCHARWSRSPAEQTMKRRLALDATAAVGGPAQCGRCRRLSLSSPMLMMTVTRGGLSPGLSHQGPLQPREVNS